MLHRLMHGGSRSSASARDGPEFVPSLSGAWRVARRVFAGILIMVASAAIFVAHAADVLYVYDDMGRLVEVVAPDGTSARYVYDPAGNITSITKNTVTTVSIAWFTPGIGPVATPVTIYGSGFSTTPANNTVKFNGVAAAVSAATATSLNVTVPATATTGTIAVTVAAVTATSTSSFTVGSASTLAPTISVFAPLIGVATTAVAITGTGFQTLPSNNQVRFGTWAAPVSSASATSISTAVPLVGEASGKISVTTPYGTAVSAADFYAVPTGSLASQIGVNVRLTVDGSAVGVTTAVNKKALLIFDAAQGAWITLGLTSGTYTGSTTTTVYKLDGTQLASKTSANNDRLDFRIPASGTYTIMITPGSAGTITAQLKSAVTGNLTAGVASTVTVGTNQMAVYTVAGAKGDALQVDVLNVAIPGTTTVTALYPDEHRLASVTTSGANTYIAPNTLYENGTYRILVQPGGSAGGSIGIRPGNYPDLAISNLIPGAITVRPDGAYSVPVTYTVTNVGQTAAWMYVWYDSCYSSTNNTFEPNNDYLYIYSSVAAPPTPGPLHPSAYYSRTVTCVTPVGTPPGLHWLFVMTEQQGYLAEPNETNNVSSPLQVTLP